LPVLIFKKIKNPYLIVGLKTYEAAGKAFLQGNKSGCNGVVQALKCDPRRQIRLILIILGWFSFSGHAGLSLSISMLVFL